MATVVKNLPVPWHRQEQPFFCGPACVSMILGYLGMSLTQNAVWTTIKENTFGARPSMAPPSDGMFMEQRCYECGSWQCWDTTPEALAAAINLQAWSGSVVWESYPPTLDAALLEIVASLDVTSPKPVGATIFAINHWIVVTGYHLGDNGLPDAPPIAVGSLQMNGVYINDPLWAAFDPLLAFVPTKEFRRRMGVVACGPNLDRYPLVVAASGFWKSWWKAIVRRVIPSQWWLRIIAARS